MNHMLQRVPIHHNDLVQPIQHRILGWEITQTPVREKVLPKRLLQIRLLEVKRRGELFDVTPIRFGLAIENGGYVPFITADSLAKLGEGELRFDFGIVERGEDGRERGEDFGLLDVAR